jgi:hypothetical protein
MYKLLLLVSLLVSSISSAKIVIFTYSYNRPDFIEIQHKTFAAFLEDDYEFVVFDDSRDQAITDKIKSTCDALNIRHIKIPQEIHDRPYLERLPGENYNHPTVRNVNVVQYSLNELGFDHDDIVALLDSDLFLTRPFCIRDFMKGFGIGAARIHNGHISYLWHGLTFLDMPNLPNHRTLTFNCGKIDERPIDAGGYSYYYLKNNPEVPVRNILQYWHSANFACEDCRTHKWFICTHNTELLKSKHMSDPEIEFLQSAHNVEFYYNNTFLHYRGGTNWNNQDTEYHAKKTYALNRYLEKILP